MVQDAPEKREGQSATNRGDHIDPAELSVCEVKLGTQLLARQADEKRLPKRREEGQQEAAKYPSSIIEQKTQHPRRLRIRARTGGHGLMPAF